MWSWYKSYCLNVIRMFHTYHMYMIRMKHANLTDQWFAEKFTGNILFHWSGWKLFLDHLWIFGCYYLRYVCYVSSIVALFCVTELLLTVAALGLARSAWVEWCGVMNGSCPVRRFIRRWKRLVIDGSVVFTVINSLNELAEGGLDKHAANSIVSCDCSQAARSKETFFYFLLLVFSSGSVGQTEIWGERRSEREEDNSAEMKQRRHMFDICLHFYVDVRYLFFWCISCSGKVIRAERTAGFYTSALSAEVEEASRSSA